jgi:hypothetical protein
MRGFSLPGDSSLILLLASNPPKDEEAKCGRGYLPGKRLPAGTSAAFLATDAADARVSDALT